MKKSTKIYSTLSFFLLMQLLSACTTETSDNKSTELTATPAKAVDNTQAKDLNQKPTFLALSIDHRCIGCGRCTMLDPEHFAQSSNARQAIVKSNNNLSSPKLSQAISICPTKSIKLI